MVKGGHGFARRAKSKSCTWLMRWRARSAVTSFALGREVNLDLRSRAVYFIIVDAHKRQTANVATATGVLAAEGCHSCCRRPGVVRVAVAYGDAEGMLNCCHVDCLDTERLSHICPRV